MCWCITSTSLPYALFAFNAHKMTGKLNHITNLDNLTLTASPRIQPQLPPS